MFLIAWGILILIVAGLTMLFFKTIDFVFKEKTEIVYPEEVTENVEYQIEEKPQKVIIKNDIIDTSKIINYEGQGVETFEFRPQTWEQFIAQDEAKQRAKTIIKKARRGIRSHLILSAIKGHGKTTFIELLAKSMGARLIQRIGKQVDEDDLVNIINEINQSEEKFVVLFIDEIDSMDWKVIKVLNPIIEQFKINNKKIKPFIFACATINKHILIQQNPDTLDRIPHHIQFTRYTADDISRIIKQYQQYLYSQEVVSEEIIRIIAMNCKFNPRTAIALLEDYIVEKNIKEVLYNCHIIKDGLTNIDIKILETLSKSKRAMGANAVALRAGLSQSQYMQEYEPFLYEFGYINRTPSREITNKGKQILEVICEKSA